MKLYCLVENNTVVQGPTTLPSNLVEKTDFELLELGWYFTQCIRPTTFNDRYEIMLPLQFDIQPHKVICTFEKRNKTQEELDTQNTIKQSDVETDKNTRLAAATEFMQSLAYTELTDENKTKWITYIDIVTNTITTNLGNDIWNVNFPSPPQTSNITSLVGDEGV